MVLCDIVKSILFKRVSLSLSFVLLSHICSVRKDFSYTKRNQSRGVDKFIHFQLSEYYKLFFLIPSDCVYVYVLR
jgi:hypothetical protein